MDYKEFSEYKFHPKKIIGRKSMVKEHRDQKKYGSKKLFCSKDIRSRFLLVQIDSGAKIFWAFEIFCLQNVVSKNGWFSKFCYAKNIMSKDILLQKFSCLNEICVSIIQSSFQQPLDTYQTSSQQPSNTLQTLCRHCYDKLNELSMARLILNLR